ncbi:MAG: biotin--[acetyl-CoA-carboxylase] ligase [Saprospiraceae bacterium]|nr:biotin--[acetyl-CoA-carboxylase] ligase [Saprospiraceae bacterium]
MRFNFPHLSFVSTDSTNIQALHYLSKTSPQSGFMLIADYQTGGKGQFGRNWESEAGLNLLCSFIFGPLNWNLDRLFNLHLISALSSVQLLSEYQLPHLSVKWPNDIYSGPHKVAGILIQNIIKENKLHWTVIGVGINVNQTSFPAGLNATSLALEKGIQFSVDALAIRFREILVNFFKEDIQEHSLLKKYNELLYSKNQWKTMHKNEGFPIQAKILKISEEGHLIVEKQNGELISIQHGELNIDW